MKKALTVAGSDNSGGAGIQADLKVFSAFGIYGMTAITSITVQNTKGVIETIPVNSQTLYNQIKSIAEDIGIDVLKVGMLQTAENVEILSEAIDKFNLNLNVIDTVIKSKNNKSLLNDEAIDLFIKKIIPKSFILTPNIPEAERLTGNIIKDIEDMKKSAKELYKMGAKYIVLKGGHLPMENKIFDIIYDGNDFVILEYPFVKAKNTHGTGCTYASAIASNIVKQKDIIKAIRIARIYLQGAIENSTDIGLNHFWMH